MKKITLITAATVALLGITSMNTAWTKSVEDKVKDWVDDCSKSLKKGVEELGEDFDAIQDYLNNYSWKGIIQEKASSGPATLSHLELNEHSKAIVVKPGETIDAEVKCDLDSKQCSALGVYRIVVGIPGEGPQAVIGNESGLFAGKTREKFTLTAPEKKGFYQIRFRPVDALFQSTALDGWVDDHNHEPSAKTTIGIIVVK